MRLCKMPRSSTALLETADRGGRIVSMIASHAENNALSLSPTRPLLKPTAGIVIGVGCCVKTVLVSKLAVSIRLGSFDWVRVGEATHQPLEKTQSMSIAT